MKGVFILTIIISIVVVTKPFSFGETGSREKILNLFNYDNSSPLNLKMEKSNGLSNGVSVYNVVFSSPAGRNITAYLVFPGGKGPFGGLIFMHWLGNPDGDYNEFLNEAETLAVKGVVSILPNGYLPWWESQSGSFNDTNLVITQVVELRRTLDVLLKQDGVDPMRIGFVGHDFGAMHGAVLSGIEYKRISFYVLMAGTGSYSDWAGYFFNNSDKTGFDKYKEIMSVYDPVSNIQYAAPAGILFQFGTMDNYIPEPKAKAFYEAARPPKELKFYETGHALNKEAMIDRDNWILEKLGIK